MDSSHPAVRAYKIVRWVVLGALVLVIVQMLRKPADVAPPMDSIRKAEYVSDFNGKLEEMVRAQQQNRAPQPATFTANEINAAIADSLARGGVEAAGKVDVGQAPVKSAQVNFTGDEVEGQFHAEIYGRDVTITVRGHLGSQDGYVTFNPTGFQVGDMSIPASMVNEKLQQKLAAPENRDKLKLPEFVKEVRVENGQLVVVPK